MLRVNFVGILLLYLTNVLCSSQLIPHKDLENCVFFILGNYCRQMIFAVTFWLTTETLADANCRQKTPCRGNNGQRQL